MLVLALLLDYNFRFTGLEPVCKANHSLDRRLPNGRIAETLRFRTSLVLDRKAHNLSSLLCVFKLIIQSFLFHTLSRSTGGLKM